MRSVVNRAILFDLFGTVVRFLPHVPSGEGSSPAGRTLLWWLEPLCHEHLPGVPFSAFVEALSATSREIADARAPEFFEVPSQQRFARALARLGLDPERSRSLAPLFSGRHMAHLTAQTEPAPGVHEVLRQLRGRVWLGLVSNFDHEAAAEQVLARHGLKKFFDTVRISAGFGRRKPHPAIFHAALEGSGVRPDQALFVGDHLEEDILGAAAAGLRPVWLCPSGPSADVPNGVTVIRSLKEVLDLDLDLRSGLS